MLCSCALYIVRVFPSLLPFSPPGLFPPSTSHQSSGIFSLFSLQLVIVNNSTCKPRMLELHRPAAACALAANKVAARNCSSLDCSQSRAEDQQGVSATPCPALQRPRSPVPACLFIHLLPRLGSFSTSEASARSLVVGQIGSLALFAAVSRQFAGRS